MSTNTYRSPIFDIAKIQIIFLFSKTHQVGFISRLFNNSTEVFIEAASPISSTTKSASDEADTSLTSHCKD